MSTKRSHLFAAFIIVFSTVFVKLKHQMFVDIFGTCSIINFYYYYYYYYYHYYHYHHCYRCRYYCFSSSSPSSSSPSSSFPLPSSSFWTLAFSFSSFSTKSIFYGVGLSAPLSNPNLEDQSISFCLGHHL
jgi:hypothetical protein